VSQPPFVQGASTDIINNTDNFIIAAFLGPAYIVFYAIPFALVRNIRMLILNITHAFLPLFSHLSAKDDKENILKYYITPSRYLVATVLLSGTMAALLGADFISLWIGERFRDNSTDVLYALILFIIVPLLNPFSSHYLTAIGEHKIFAQLEPVAAVSNIGISILLVEDYGLLGIALGSLIPVVIVHLVYLWRTCYWLDISVSTFIKQCWFPTILPTMICIFVTYNLQLWETIESYLWLFTVAGVGSITFVVTFLLLANSTDKEIIRKFLLKLKSPREI